MTTIPNFRAQGLITSYHDLGAAMSQSPRREPDFHVSTPPRQSPNASKFATESEYYVLRRLRESHRGAGVSRSRRVAASPAPAGDEGLTRHARPPKATHLYLGEWNLGMLAARACGSSMSGSSEAAPLLRVDQHHVGYRAVVTAVGEVDLSSTAELGEAIEAARERGASEIRLDLTGTTFMDCAGLRRLLEARARLIEEERRLVLICPPGPVLRLLTLTGVDRVLEIHPTHSAASNAT